MIVAGALLLDRVATDSDLHTWVVKIGVHPLELLQSSIALRDGSWGCATLHPRLSPCAPLALLQMAISFEFKNAFIAQLASGFEDQPLLRYQSVM